MSKLLFDEAPLVVDVTLATALGVDTAIVLQQVHYWISINQKKDYNFYEGAYWTYNSIKDWQKTFPFYTERTLQRIFKKLKEDGILKAGNFNKAKFDKTTWYTIDYKKLEERVSGEDVQTSRQNGNIEERECVNDDDKMAQRERQNGITTATKWHNDDDKLATPIPETSTEISSEISSETSHIQSARVPYQEIIDTYNQTCSSLPQVQQLSDKRKRAIKKIWQFAKGRMDVLVTLFDKAECSDFLAGRAKEWQANFDWIIKVDKAVAILEGQYDNRAHTFSNPQNMKGLQDFLKGEE